MGNAALDARSIAIRERAIDGATRKDLAIVAASLRGISRVPLGAGSLLEVFMTGPSVWVITAAGSS